MKKTVEYRSKGYVIKSLFNEAKKSPFIAQMQYHDYLIFLYNQIKQLSGSEISNLKESNVFDALYKIGWIRKIENNL